MVTGGAADDGYDGGGHFDADSPQASGSRPLLLSDDGYPLPLAPAVTGLHVRANLTWRGKTTHFRPLREISQSSSAGAGWWSVREGRNLIPLPET